jgi:hypothetical protein
MATFEDMERVGLIPAPRPAPLVACRAFMVRLTACLAHWRHAPTHTR